MCFLVAYNSFAESAGNGDYGTEQIDSKQVFATAAATKAIEYIDVVIFG